MISLILFLLDDTLKVQRKTFIIEGNFQNLSQILSQLQSQPSQFTIILSDTGNIEEILKKITQTSNVSKVQIVREYNINDLKGLEELFKSDFTEIEEIIIKPKENIKDVKSFEKELKSISKDVFVSEKLAVLESKIYDSSSLKSTISKLSEISKKYTKELNRVIAICNCIITQNFTYCECIIIITS
ncbi:MAG: hypothetical protein ABIL76_04620 [candidate division WOR-3 bacterium]